MTNYRQEVGPGGIGIQGPGAEVNIFPGHDSPPRIEEIPAIAGQSSRWLREQPSRLLDARSEVVPFAGRSSELEQLTDWRESTSAAESYLLVHASGGQGKTRLAARFAAVSREAGWKVAQGRPGSDLAEASTGRGIALGDGAGLLLMVDYADRWPIADLNRLFSDPALDAGVPIRVLLLGRSGRYWWPSMRNELANARNAATADLSLSPLAPGRSDRRRVFAAAVARFCEPDLYAIPDPDLVSVPDSFDHVDYGMVLTLHMAALVSVDAHHRGLQAPGQPHELSAYLLDREYAAWQRHYASGKGMKDKEYATPPSVMSRTVFAATLTGASAYGTGEQIIRQLDLGLHPKRIIDDHLICYPPTDQNTALEPLYPDRLAEDFIALLMPGHDITAYDSDPWTANVPSNLLARNGDTPAVYTPRTITFLAAATDRWPHLGRQCLYPLLTADPRLAIDAGNAALTTLAAIGVNNDTIDPDLLNVLLEVEALFPRGRHIDLDTGIAALTQRLVESTLDVIIEPDDRADSYALLNTRLTNAGLDSEAAATSHEIVSLRRALAEAGSGTRQLSLAEALNTLSTDLTRVGQPGEALAAGTEAVAIHRKLAQTDPKYNRPLDLARALNSVSNALSSLGRSKQALATSQEALNIQQESARAQGKPSQGLAVSLTTYGANLEAQGQHTDALAALEAALVAYRELAEAEPTKYLPDLASSLSSLSTLLSKRGRSDDALARSEEALMLLRSLVKSNPAAHNPLLAALLVNITGQRASLGQYAAALLCADEAVALYRQLAYTSPAAHLPDLAMALNNYATALSGAGRTRDALVPVEEAVAIRRRLVKSDGTAHLPDLANALTTLGASLSKVRRHEDSLPYTREAISIRRKLATTNPTAYRPDLATSLHNLSHALSALGRQKDALAPAEEAVNLLRNLAEQEPAAYEADLAVSLDNLGGILHKFGRDAESLAIAKASLEINRRLAIDNPAAHLPGLAASWVNLSGCLARLKNKEKALTASEEALKIYRDLTGRDPVIHMPRLAAILSNCGILLSDLGKYELAVAATEEAIDICRNLVESDPAVYMSDLAQYLANLIPLLRRLRRRRQAFSTARQYAQVRILASKLES